MPHWENARLHLAHGNGCKADNSGKYPYTKAKSDLVIKNDAKSARIII
jgi:hypothetical protein